MKIQFRIWHVLVATLLVAIGTVYIQHHRFQSKLKLKKIQQLDLSLRATNCLIYAEVETVGELIKRTEDQLLAVRNMGHHNVFEIRSKLEAMGLELKAAK